MSITAVCLFIICLIFFIIGVIGIVYHHRVVEAWDEHPSTSEYMGCLLFGWCSWMITVFAGIFILTFVLGGILNFKI